VCRSPCLGVTLGRATPPDAIKHQRIATAEQEQRQKTEQQAKLAEDQRRRAHEESRALADNAYRESMKLSVEQYIELMRINMLQQACARRPVAHSSTAAARSRLTACADAMPLTILDSLLKIILLAMEGQTPEQRAKMWEW
jgi:hypothetical protein